MRATATLLAIACWATVTCRAQVLTRRQYAERCVDYYSRQYGVSPALVRAIIHVESAWDPGAVSAKGAVGLMQLMPATAQQFGASHPFQIHENVRAGVAYLAALMRRFDGDLRLVTAAYAAGDSPILSRGLYFSSADVYCYVQRVAQQYGIELRLRGQERR